MQPKFIVIFGSSRSNGHTKKAVDLAFDDIDHEFVDLSKLSISEFNYESKNEGDDFLSLAKKMQTYNHIVFATPIYWYGPSTTMKIFIDRFSDILREPWKHIGKSFKDKNVYVVSSNGVSPSRCFEEQFELTCDYMDMHYVGCYNYHSGEDKQQLYDSNQSLISFREKISG